eukprot:667647-Alexandrium_andersonii.AAC.1
MVDHQLALLEEGVHHIGDLPEGFAPLHEKLRDVLLALSVDLASLNPRCVACSLAICDTLGSDLEEA